MLFPLRNRESTKLLKFLTQKKNFDTDILVYAFRTLCNDNERKAEYGYFASELGDLYNEQLEPTLRGAQKWWEKKSGARYVMMVTIAGFVFIFLALALAAFQTWISWQQWQHPITPTA